MSQDLDRITSRTKAHYNESAEAFWEGTRDHDVSQNIEALLNALQGEPPFTILDFGCGPGRDLLDFARRGHRAIGLEGTPRFVDMARAYSGCEVWHQDFLALDLPPERFDGIFANASLFHVPGGELPRVLGQLHAALKPGGVLFASNPLGHGQEGWSGDRYGVWHDPSSWRQQGQPAGFTELSHYYRPVDQPPEARRWLATLWRKSVPTA
jgi:SAM-dependent methyltransferase